MASADAWMSAGRCATACSGECGSAGALKPSDSAAMRSMGLRSGGDGRASVGFARSCTTAEVWRMGFSRVVVFSTANWADAAAPVRELNEAFRPRQPIADLSRASTEALQAAIAPTFQRGDVLFTINCVRARKRRAIRCAILRTTRLSSQVHEYADWAEDERARASAAVAKLIDAVSEVWLQYDAMDDPELGAVVVILENSKATALAADYGPDDKGMEYPVTELDEQLSAFFR